MPDYLQRDQAPLSDGQWTILEQAAVTTAGSMLVGRRFLTLVGPFGPGVEAVPNDILAGTPTGQIDLLGDAEPGAIHIERRTFLPLPLLYKDFWIHWRDVDANRRLGLPLDTATAAAAASSVAMAEDQLIFNGDPQLDIPGLRTMPGRQTMPLSDWSNSGSGFADTVAAMRLLLDAGFPGPYTLVVSPRRYADLNRIFDNTGVLEIEQVQRLIRGGVYPSVVLPEPSAILVDPGADNMDLAVALDLSLAFLTTEHLNLKLRVLESLVPRVHRPSAIVVMDSGTMEGEGGTGRAAGRQRG
ncbi:MAG TPA: family 1 encapsulin nanocompartment shell protein [Thermomicrobiaceae bacterium]|nr:family 1 encapsulin nanocompartment shell protein [Thermomicrobiaceae bacterium]